MMKIPVTRLKIAQIDRETLPFSVRCYCMEHPAFVDTADDPQELFCHADIFQKMLDEQMEFYHTSLVDETINTLTDLNKQFCSFDYIMLI